MQIFPVFALVFHWTKAQRAWNYIQKQQEIKLFLSFPSDFP